MKTRFVAILALMTVPFFVACGGNVCEDAAEVCGASEGEGEGECTGQAECVSQCIVDADSCDLTDPDLGDCVGGCA